MSLTHRFLAVLALITLIVVIAVAAVGMAPDSAPKTATATSAVIAAAQTTAPAKIVSTATLAAVAQFTPTAVPPTPDPCTFKVSATQSTDTLSLQAAVSRAGPGSTICLQTGQYTMRSTLVITTSGRPDAWIVLRAGAGQSVNIVWDPAQEVRKRGVPMIFFTGASAAYWEVRDLNLDASNQANAGVFCRKGHHIRVINTHIQNGDESGISTVECDYVTAIGNRIYRSGYGRGWSSGISLNRSRWQDRYQGFHSVILGNAISGMFDNSDNHTDGNGIILDLSAGYVSGQSELAQADTPPVLIANNVVFNNGGACLGTFGTSNVWIINNTCYRNALDPKLRNPGEIKINASKNVIAANNLAVGERRPYLVTKSSDIQLINNLFFGDDIAIDQAAERGFINQDPLFTDPPPGSDYTNALAPWDIGTRLATSIDSPVVDSGVDPATLTDDIDLKNDLTTLLATDINGAPRLQGELRDRGAYEVR